MAMIPVIEEMKKARRAAAGVIRPVLAFRMIGAAGDDLGVVVRTRRPEACALEVRHALAAVYRKTKNAEPPSGWLFRFESVSGG